MLGVALPFGFATPTFIIEPKSKERGAHSLSISLLLSSNPSRQLPSHFCFKTLLWVLAQGSPLRWEILWVRWNHYPQTAVVKIAWRGSSGSAGITSMSYEMNRTIKRFGITSTQILPAGRRINIICHKSKRIPSSKLTVQGCVPIFTAHKAKSPEIRRFQGFWSW